MFFPMQSRAKQEEQMMIEIGAGYRDRLRA